MMETKLSLITRIAKSDKECKFNNLMHMINKGSLRECFKRLARDKAAGVDRMTKEEYGMNLEDNLEKLLMKMKQMSYRPQPVRRTYIPKIGGKRRPLGIPALEDKMVQMAFTMILEAIYEVDFCDNSYGYRKGRNCHDALARINSRLMVKPVNYIVDADIKGFFDNVEHQWLMRCLEVRIADKKFLRYITRFLKSGIMEEGKYMDTERGTPQGGVISPMLANIYLHYVLDRWFTMNVQDKCKGYTDLVRYCDDFIICAQHEREAHRILELIKQRFEKFGLELSETKTRIVEFGRLAMDRKSKEGKRVETFYFLGFTHYCSRSRSGKFKVGRKTEKKRYARGVKKVQEFVRSCRNLFKLEEIWKRVRLMLIGHYRYYGVNENSRSLSNFRYEVTRVLFKWLNRRSQRRSFCWDKFNLYLKLYPLPQPRIYTNLYEIAYRSEWQ
jgi:RNA-directed DNA polymerase